MNVSTLQQFLRSLVPALQATDGGSRAAQDLERVCRGLESFIELDLDAFVSFLARCDEYQRNGAVSPPSDFDLNPLQQSLQRFDEARDSIKSNDESSTKRELAQVQHKLHESLTELAASVGLKGKLKADPKWIDAQLVKIRVSAHGRSLRELASRIADPAAFERDDVRTEIKRLEKEISPKEWKVLASEFSLPASTKGAKGVGEILFKLTGNRPVAAKATRKSGPAPVDSAKIERYAAELDKMLERAKNEAEIPEVEVDEQMNRLKGLSSHELVAVAKKAGIANPGRSSVALLKKIRGYLMAGRRIAEQTAQ